MRHIIKRNVRPLSNGLAIRNPNRHILQVLVRIRERAQHQGLVLRALGREREADGGHLLAVDVVADGGDGPALREALGRARVGAEAIPEAGEVEGADAGPADELGVGV